MDYVDLKTFFSSMSVGSSSTSRPSTRESQNAAAVESQEVVQDEESAQIQSVVAEIDGGAAVEQQPEVEQQPVGEGHNGDGDGGINLIREFDPNVHVISDPALRIPFEQFHPNIIDEVKRAYLLKGPTQPKDHTFVREKYRAFRAAWFADYDWLEYSVTKKAAYCFYCFLFRKEADHEKFGHDVFTKIGYTNWKQAASRGFPDHCRAVNGCHNKARQFAVDFSNQRKSISRKFEVNSITSEQQYEIRVNAALDIARFLIAQGHAFRGHDESSSSLNKGNFLEMLDWYKKKNNEVRVAFDELCPKNARMTSPEIQKDLTQSCALEISKVIKEEIGGNLFSILIDESRDISIAEQMAVIVRLVLISQFFHVSLFLIYCIPHLIGSCLMQVCK